MRSFGRRRARRLTPRQENLLDDELSRLRLDLSSPPPADLTRLFKGQIREVWLEIGFGGGEHLLHQARTNPDVGIIGCEPFIDGVVKVVDGAITRGLDNILIHSDDARDVLNWLPDEVITRTFVLFPDPWPKKRHTKRRLVNISLLVDVARVMAPAGELRLATDIGDYAKHMLQAIRRQGSFEWTAHQPANWRVRPPDWPDTRYENKAIREGRRCYFMRFERRS